MILLRNILRNLHWGIQFFYRTKYYRLFVLFEFLAWFGISECAIWNILTIFGILIKNQFWEACNTASPFTLLGNRASMSRLWSLLFPSELFFGPNIGGLKLFFIRIWIWKWQLIIQIFQSIFLNVWITKNFRNPWNLFKTPVYVFLWKSQLVLVFLIIIILFFCIIKNAFTSAWIIFGIFL